MVNMSPLAQQLGPAGPAVTPEAEDLPPLRTAWRILVVEDVPSQQRLLVTMLTKSGHTVTAVDSGRKAVELVQQQPFDLVLMDVQMPGMDGLEATRAIRDQEARLGGHLPIVAVTAHALNGDDEKCRKAGADAYMRKPLNLVEMMALLKRIAGRGVSRFADESLHDE